MSRRTWCRVCRTELRLPTWKALMGLRSATCKDEAACAAAYHSTGEAVIREGRSRMVLRPQEAPVNHR